MRATNYTYTDDSREFAHDFRGQIQRLSGHTWITIPPDDLTVDAIDCLADDGGFIEDGATGEAHGWKYRAIAADPILADDNHNAQAALRAAWNACDSVVMRITDTDGSNPANAAVRHLIGETWLSVCDDDGFTLINASEVESLENAGCLVAD